MITLKAIMVMLGRRFIMLYYFIFSNSNISNALL